MRKQVTLTDIAQQLGISKSSVSLALNNRPGVSEELRRSVLEVAQRMGYEGKTVHSRQSPRSRTILLLHQEYRAQHSITGVRLGYVEGVQAAADSFGFQVVVDSLATAGPATLSLDILRTRPDHVVGVLLVGMKGPDDPTVALVQQAKVPLVIVNRYWPDTALSFVSVDFFRAEANAVRYLVGLGHRHIAFVGLICDTDYSWYRQRREGYLAALETEGAPSDPRFIIETTNVEQAADKLLSQASVATAACAVSDAVAVGLLDELQRRGKRVPSDISVIGFDNDHRLLPTSPALTTVDFNEFNIGYRAVHVIVEHMGDADLSHLQVIVKTNLVERESCAAPRGTSSKAAG
jgi:LacI family transcriptional regulator